MEFESKNFVDNLYETSKTSDGSYLLNAKEKELDVYNMDHVKDWFCDNYRAKQKLHSCDAYYSSEHNRLVMEFKNTHHFNLKEYIDDIQVKFIDTYLLLRETFLKNSQAKEFRKKVNLILVYNDALSQGEGIRRIGDALNNMKAIRGNGERNTSVSARYQNEEEYLKEIEAIKQTYEKRMYRSVEFLDKKRFYEDYVHADYFKEPLCG